MEVATGIRRGIARRHRSAHGFTLIEGLIALSVLTVGVMTMAAVISRGLVDMRLSPVDLIARQKMAEAIESVYYARDTRLYTWAQICNVSNGGIFLDGPQPLKTPGADGLINTADDGAVETVVQPGKDGLLNTADDVKIALNEFTREIKITTVSSTLKQIAVTVIVKTGTGGQRKYTVTTLISSFC